MKNAFGVTDYIIFSKDAASRKARLWDLYNHESTGESERAAAKKRLEAMGEKVGAPDSKMSGTGGGTRSTRRSPPPPRGNRPPPRGNRPPPRGGQSNFEDFWRQNAGRRPPPRGNRPPPNFEDLFGDAYRPNFEDSFEEARRRARRPPPDFDDIFRNARRRPTAAATHTPGNKKAAAAALGLAGAGAGAWAYGAHRARKKRIQTEEERRRKRREYYHKNKHKKQTVHKAAKYERKKFGVRDKGYKDEVKVGTRGRRAVRVGSRAVAGGVAGTGIGAGVGYGVGTIGGGKSGAASGGISGGILGGVTGAIVGGSSGADKNIRTGDRRVSYKGKKFKSAKQVNAHTYHKREQRDYKGRAAAANKTTHKTANHSMANAHRDIADAILRDKDKRYR